MYHFNWLLIYVGIGWLLRALMIPTVLRRDFAPGAAIAWLGIVWLHPYIGLALYLAIGETRLEPGRLERQRQIVHKFRSGSLCTDEARRARSDIPESAATLVIQAEKISGLPGVGGNEMELIGDSAALVDRLAGEIDKATEQVNLLYYIFASDESGRKIAQSLIAAAKRGVKCRVLADAVASRAFFRSRGLAEELKAGGVEVAAALPVAPLRRRLSRMDLRNHRKLAVIDDQLGFLGSQNLINADYGGRKGGPWVDLTVVLTGPIVEEISTVFAEDWEFETGTELKVPDVGAAPPHITGAAVQLVPTGPTNPGDNFRRLFLAALQAARERIVMTTPYFVPDEPTLVAMLMAADRGVNVKLLVPARPDHFFTAAAGRAHFTRLLEGGITIHEYQPALLHSKTTSVDDAFAIVGSANLDVRSFNLNFEASLVFYGKEPTQRVRDIQEGYLRDCTPILLDDWRKRGVIRQYSERALSLLSPLL